jgi:glycosyltransferase involved in cell wall biosynthesis
MPGVLIEAGMSGLPVVTTAVPGADDVVANGETGLVVGVDDTEGLLRATRALVVDARRRRQMGAAARDRCVSRYGIEASTRAWQAVIMKMIDDQCTSSI